MSLFEPDDVTTRLIALIQAKRAHEIVAAPSIEARALWARRGTSPFELDKDLGKRLAKSAEPLALAQTVVASIESALGDLDEHGEHSEFSGDGPALRRLLTRWQKHARAAGPNAIDPAFCAEVVRRRDAGISAMTFPLEAATVLGSAKDAQRLEQLGETENPAVAGLIVDWAKLPRLAPLVGEAVGAKVSRALAAIDAKRSRKDFARAHALIRAFAAYVAKHDFPAFYGQAAVASAAGVVWQSKHEPSDKLIVGALAPIAGTGTRLQYKLAQLHAAMMRKPALLAAIRAAIDLGQRPDEISDTPFTTWKRDRDVAALLAGGSARV